MASGSLVPGEWVPSRLLLYRALLASPSFDLAAWVDPLLIGLPFRLGESTAEATIPFAFDDDFNDLAEVAVDDLADLLRRRRDPPPAGLDLDGSARRLPPATSSLGGFPEGSLALPIAARVLRLDAGLDCGIVEGWVPRGHGGPLLERLSALYGRLLEEDLRTGGGAAHLALGLLGTLGHLESKKVRAKGLVTRALTPEKLDHTLGAALFGLVEGALERALCSRSGVPAALELQARALLCPLAFVSTRQKAIQAEVNAWGLPESFAEAADRVWLALLEENPNPRAAEQRITAAFLDLPELRARAASAGAILLARKRAFDWLACYDGIDPEVSAAVGAFARSEATLCATLQEPKGLLQRLQKLSKSLKPDAAGDAATAALVESLRRGPERDDAVREVAAAYVVLAFDRVTVGAIDRARSRLKDRRLEYPRERLVADYLAGRLYRLSADGKPIRRALSRKTQGHLFIDLKGFTQRTYRAKELVMAEFLRTEFYEPILAAAARRAEGLGGERLLTLQNLLGDAAVFSGQMPALVELAQDIQRACRAYAEKLRARTGSDGRDLDARRAEVETRLRGELDRLRGDAAIIEREMQAQRAAPSAQLEQQLFGTLAQRIADLDARRHDALQRGRIPDAQRAEEAAAAIRQREKDLFARVEPLFGAARDQLIADLVLAEDRTRLRELERRAAETRAWAQGQLRALEEEARSTRGGGLEAGLFITFGANAEVATMSEASFGPVKVAIAEKINEAARGTARNGIIKSKLDALLGRARAQRNNPRLDLPFRVYVDSASNLLLPTELTEMIDTAVRERDPGRAREAARGVAEMVLRDLARAMGMGDGQQAEALTTLSDIYNTGEALSGEAAAAYLTQTAPGRVWFRKVLATEDLDPEFHELFLFLQDSLELAISVPADGDADRAIVFRRAGQVQFRGFEAKSPTSVWELLRADSPFALLLAQKHVPLWAAEAREQPPGELPT